MVEAFEESIPRTRIADVAHAFGISEEKLR
jgi:predicted Zn-dependent protease with MMP-like domain